MKAIVKVKMLKDVKHESNMLIKNSEYFLSRFLAQEFIDKGLAKVIKENPIANLLGKNKKLTRESVAKSDIEKETE